jgi:hypothetical protein
MRIHTATAIGALLVSLFMGVLTAGCGGPSEFAMTGTERSAGTDGLVTVEELEGGNHMVTLELAHLPPPNRLGEGLTTYVVWFTAPEQAAQKASLLAYDEDDRTGRATATTPLSRFTVSVTAERNGNSGTPSDIVVARRQVQ